MVSDFKAVARLRLGYLSEQEFVSPQAAVDYALENLEPIVHLTRGSYSLSDTLHVGYGVGVLHSIQVHGRMGYGFAAGAPSTRLLADFVDRPVVNIQGGRNSGLDKVYIQGPDSIDYQGGQPLATRANRATYTPAGAANFPNSPYCGVCIDGYFSSPAPSNPYPTPDYPAYLGVVTGAYGRLQSSACFITDCLISSTFVGVASQPYTDANADFNRFTNLVIREQVICISVGNSQARSQDYQNIRANTFHTFVDAIRYGHGIGNVGGNWSNIHLDDFYQIFNIEGGWSVPFLVDNLYSEVGMRIGDLGGAIVKFVGCLFDTADIRYSGSVITEAYVPSVMSGAANFEATRFYNHRGPYHFENECSFDRCLFQAKPDGPQPTGAELEAMRGVLANVINQPTFLTTLPGESRFRNCTHQGAAGLFAFDGYDSGVNANIWAVGQNPEHPVKYDFSHLACVATESVGSSSLGAAGTPAGHTLTLTMTPAYFEAGDVFYDYALRWWYCSAVSGAGPYTVTLKALTGYRFDGTNYWLMKRNATTNDQEDSTEVISVALYYVPRGFRDFEPRANLFFKTTATSPTLEIVNGAGAAANLPAGPTTKSKPLWYGPPTTNAMGRVPFPSRTYVTAVDLQSLTMSANALVSGVWAFGPGIARIS